MKKLTAIYPDEAIIDLSKLMAASTEFRVDTLANGKPPRRVHRDPTMSVPECVMAHYTHGAEFKAQDAERWLQQKGFAVNSAGAAVSKLVRDGQVVKVGKGRFRFEKPLTKGA